MYKEQIESLIERNRELLTNAYKKAQNLPIDSDYKLIISTAWGKCLALENNGQERSVTSFYANLQQLHNLVQDTIEILTANQK